MIPNQIQESPSQRADRFTSHALVEIRKFKMFPLFVKSAVLLDISSTGFKAEFTGENHARPGERIWLNVPLTPLGIYSPSRLLIRGEIKWFDGAKFRFGGIFSGLGKDDANILQQVIESLRKRGFLL